VVAFHAGQKDDFTRGLDVMLAQKNPSQPSRILLEADEAVVAHVQWHFGTNVLLASMSEEADAKYNLDEGEIAKVADVMKDDQGRVAPLISELFEQVIGSAARRARGK